MRRFRLIAVMFAALMLFGACAQDDPTVGAPDETTQPTDEAADADATVAVADSDHGEILVDGEGMTLYLFTNDTDGTSTCTDACATTWPALTVDGEATAGDGADESLLSTTERDDGAMQVTYNGKPLYHYSGDTAAGETKGQGVGGRWYVVSPEGDAIEE